MSSLFLFSRFKPGSALRNGCLTRRHGDSDVILPDLPLSVPPLSQEVQEVCLEGLAIDPFHKGLLQVMKKAATELNGERTGTPAPAGADGAGPSEVQQAGAGAGAGAGAEAGAGSPSPQLGSSPPAQCQPPKRRASRMSSALLTADDADCTLCLKLMYEPVTTPW